MLLELSNLSTSSAVRTRPIGTDRLLLLKILHRKATKTQRRQLKFRPALGEVNQSKSFKLTLYDVTVLVSHGFATVSQLYT
jgi:hypothetical protein